MRILMTRINPDRHLLTIVRADGSREEANLETRSLLVHDLVHYAVEIEVPFHKGFYGLLASGQTLAALSDKTKPWPTGTEIAAAEGLVGPLQSMLKGDDFDPVAAHAQFELFRPDPPSVELLGRIGSRFRSVFGRYSSTRFGQTLELDWPEGQTSNSPPEKNRKR